MIKINDSLWEKYYQEKENAIKMALEIIKRFPDKVNNNEWKDLISSNAYIADICIITGIDFLKYMKVIQPYLFNDTYYITEIELPEGIETISHNSFNDCIHLEKIILPISLTTLEYEIFTGCKKLSIFYKGTIQQWRALAGGIQVGAFTGYIGEVIHCSDGDCTLMGGKI